MDSKIRAKSRALAVLREQQLGSTTQLTAFALGGTVSRLLSAVTLVDKPVSTFRLAVRGAFLGAALGAAALGVIVTQRYLQAPRGETATTLAASQAETIAPAPHQAQPNDSVSLENTLSLVERDLTEHRPQLALQRLDDIATAPANPVVRDRATLLRVRTLLALGRPGEAKQVTDQALSRQPQPAQRQALEALITKP
jgi:hypothetical protein